MRYRGFSWSRAGLDVLCASFLNRVRRLVLVLVLVLKGNGGSVERVTRGAGSQSFQLRAEPFLPDVIVRSVVRHDELANMVGWVL